MYNDIDEQVVKIITRESYLDRFGDKKHCKYVITGEHLMDLIIEEQRRR